MGISSSLGSSALLPAGLGFRNVLINGDMKVAQRGTSFTYATGGGSYYYGADRWRTQDYTWSAGTNPTVSNETTVVPTGFTNAYKWANGATALTFNSGGNQFINQTIEGYSASALYGKTCSLSFWVRSSTAGKYSIWFTNGAATRSLLKTYVINSANTWEYKTLTIDMTTAISSGVWEKTTSAGLSMSFNLGSHADRTGSTNLDAWGALSSYDYRTSDSVNLATIANSTFYLTGVQLEQNLQPTPFEQRPIGVELALCQRYYEKSYENATAPGTATYTRLVTMTGSAGSATTGEIIGNYYWAAVKRVAPTVSWYDHSGNSNRVTRLQYGVSNHANNVASAGTVTERMAVVSSTSGNTGQSLQFHFVADVEL